jgi:hypothetical protein
LVGAFETVRGLLFLNGSITVFDGKASQYVTGCSRTVVTGQAPVASTPTIARGFRRWAWLLRTARNKASDLYTKRDV